MNELAIDFTIAVLVFLLWPDKKTVQHIDIDIRH
jgi:hypothetical protein